MKKYRKKPRMAKANKEKLILLSKYPLCDCKKIRFIEKKQLVDY